MPIEDYAERQEAKRERLEDRADKAETRAHQHQRRADQIFNAIPMGQPLASDKATANGVGVTINSTGTSVAFTLLESAATGLALLRKTDNEAVPTGLNVRCLFIGY